MWLFIKRRETITAVKDVTIHIQEGISTESLDILEQGNQPLYGGLTFAKAICRKITIDDDVIFDGKVTLTAEQLRRKRQDIGMIFQHFNLMSQKTAEENVALPSNTLDSVRKKRRLK